MIMINYAALGCLVIDSAAQSKIPKGNLNVLLDSEIDFMSNRIVG